MTRPDSDESDDLLRKEFHWLGRHKIDAIEARIALLRASGLRIIAAATRRADGSKLNRLTHGPRHKGDLTRRPTEDVRGHHRLDKLTEAGFLDARGESWQAEPSVLYKLAEDIRELAIDIYAEQLAPLPGTEDAGSDLRARAPVGGHYVVPPSDTSTDFSRRTHLIVVRGMTGARFVFPDQVEEVTLGRGPGFTFDVGWDVSISRRPQVSVKITEEGRGFALTSPNGTASVDGRQVLPDATVFLQAGAHITLGRSGFVFRPPKKA